MFGQLVYEKRGKNIREAECSECSTDDKLEKKLEREGENDLELELERLASSEICAKLWP